MVKLSQLFSYILLLGFSGMLAWGVLGFIEYWFDVVLVVPLQNANFPKGTQFLHWVLAIVTSGVFVIGYVTRWKHTPYVMVVTFAMLATLCFIETFDFMTQPYRYVAYAAECMSYLIVGCYIMRSRRMQLRFS